MASFRKIRFCDPAGDCQVGRGRPASISVYEARSIRRLRSTATRAYRLITLVASSEGILHRKLQNLRIGSALNYAERRRTEIIHRVREIRVIQQVEKLEAKLEPLVFADLEEACQVRIHIEKPGPIREL